MSEVDPDLNVEGVEPRAEADIASAREAPPLARDELHLLAKIIERKEQVRLRQRNWVITTVSGLSLAFVSDNVGLARGKYLALALASITVFWLMETVYQHVEDRAIRRSRDLEALLRDGRPYDGPLISDSLSPPAFRDQVRYVGQTFMAPRVASPYVALIFIVIAFSLVVS